MNSIKQYYLDVLRSIPEEQWRNVYNICKQQDEPKFGSGIVKTTSLQDPSSTKLDGLNGVEPNAHTVYLMNLQKNQKYLKVVYYLPPKMLIH